MKRCLLYFLMIVFGTSVSAQNLTLQELQNLCKLQNWETGNNILSNKGWEFHDTKHGNSYQESAIVYAYGKNYYNNNRASAWFTFYTVNNRVEKIHYTATESAYKSIMSSLSSNGYKQIGSDIGYKSLTATYKNQSFQLEITTETQERDDDYGVTHAVHSLELVRLGGAYDDDNGEKTDYYYGTSNVKARYTLKDGKLNGKLCKYNYDGSKDVEVFYKSGKKDGKYTSYYENGKVKETRIYSNDVLNGQNIEYYENGNKKSEITYKDDKANGKCTTFYSDGTIKITCYAVNGKLDGHRIEYNEDGTKSAEAHFKDDELNGKYIEYDYNDDGELNYQEEGCYSDGEKDGYWETKVKYDDKWQILVFTNYAKGVKHGDAKEWIPGFDTVVYCTYTNGKLNGKYQIKGSKAAILGLTYRPWYDDLTFVDGYYADGEKTGHWSYYNKLGWLQEEGDYNDDKMSGEWKYYGMYLPDFNISEKKDTIEESTWVSVPGCLERVENYENGKLNGTVIKYRARSLHRNIIDGNDTIDYIAHYKNGILHGDYEKHDLDRIVLKGQYYDGKRDGEWLEFDSIKWSMYVFSEINDKPYYVYTETKWVGNYAKGKKNGLWEKHDDKTNQKIMSLTYRNDVLDGTQIYFYNGKEQLVDEFDNGTLKNEKAYSDNGDLLFEFNYINTKNNGFAGREVDNIQKTDIEYFYKVSKHDISEKPFNTHFDSLPKVKDGHYIEYDTQHRKLIEGDYSSDKKTQVWTYYFPEQGIYYEKNESNSDIPIHFYQNGGLPYTGIVKLKDSNSENLTIAIKVKKSLVQEIVYTNPETNKMVKKIKYKNGFIKK